MKKLAFAILISLIIFSLSGVSLELSKPGFTFSSGEYSFSMRYNKPSFSTPIFDYGDIYRKGLLKTLRDPYSENSFIPEAADMREDNSQYGAVLKLGGFRLFSTVNKDGLGIYYGNKYLESFIYYVLGSKGFYSNQKLFSENPNGNLIYSGISFNIRNYGVKGLVSYSLYGVLDCLVSGTYKDDCISFSFILGDIAALDKVKDKKCFMVDAGINGSLGSFSFSYEAGKDPVYSSEYRDIKVKHSTTIKSDNLELNFNETMNIKRDGKRDSSMRIEAKSNILRFGYDSKKKLFMKITLKDASIGYEDGKYSVTIPITLVNDNWSAEVTIGSEGASLKLSFSEFP